MRRPRERGRATRLALTRPCAEQMVYAHRRTLDQDRVILYVAAAGVALLLAGLRMRRSTETSNKFVSLILSFMWASQAVLMFGESCPSAGFAALAPACVLCACVLCACILCAAYPCAACAPPRATRASRRAASVCRNACKYRGRATKGDLAVQGGGERWPVEGILASLYFGAQSLVLTVLGNAGFLNFYRPFAHLRRSPEHQMGLFLMLLAAGWTVGHFASKGAFCKLAFPLDLFTIAFLLSTAEDSGYSKIALLLPVLGMMARCTCAAARLNEREEAPMALVSLICFYVRDRWGRRRDAYMWPEHRRQQQQQQDYGDIKTGGSGQPRYARVVRREPMIREVRTGEDGGVQGLSFVQEMSTVDEDGDEAMEFFEVTDQGLRKRTPCVSAKGRSAP